MSTISNLRFAGSVSWRISVLSLSAALAHAAPDLQLNFRAAIPGTSNQRFIVHNVSQSCGNLKSMDHALELSIQESQYFFGQWTPADYDDAVRWASGCAAYGDPRMRDTRISLLQDRKAQEIRREAAQQQEDQQAALRRTQEKEAEDRRMAAEKLAAEQTRAQYAAEEAAEQTKDLKASAAKQRCKQSSQFELFQAEDQIVEAVETKSRAEQNLAREKKIGEISGAVDLSKQYFYGQTIVRADEGIQAIWPKYKSLGGNAATPGMAHHTMRNPCGS
jgi:hypothetical protein